MSDTHQESSQEKRIAIVTGGSRGIGRAVAEALLGENRADGWKVWICSREPEGAVREMAEKFGEGRIAGRSVDVRDQGKVDAFVEEVLGADGRVDCLVNNAGLGHFAPVDELSGDQWREVIETNLNGPFYFLRAVAPGMKKQGAGWVINIASLAAKNPFPGGSAYNASKFGLVGMSEASMLDLRKHGIRMASILPGSVSTQFGGVQGEADWKLQPEDIASMVLHLLSYPDNALPSLVEMRPSRPPGK